MPQLRAAKKALRQNSRRRTINDRWRNKLRLSLRATEENILSGSKEKALKSYLETQKIIDKAAKHKIISPNKAARKKSQLQKGLSLLKKK